MVRKSSKKRPSPSKKRPSPSNKAREYKNMKLVGNDGNMYISKPDKNGVYKWVKKVECTKYVTKLSGYTYVVVSYELKKNAKLEKDILAIAQETKGVPDRRGVLKSKNIMTEVEYKFKDSKNAKQFVKFIKLGVSKDLLHESTKATIMGKNYEMFGDRTSARPECEWQQ